VRIAPTDRFLRPVGRHVEEDGRLVFGWPGTGFDVRFEGDSIAIDLSGSVSWVDVSVDGAAPAAFDLDSNRRRVVLDGLAPGTHDMRLRKRTEAMVGDLVVSGLETDGRFLSAPAGGTPRLEFYGDSITCGYGCLDPVPEHGFSPATESFQLSWAGRTASVLGAEVHAQAISGIGVARNWPGVVGTPLPARWMLAHPDRDVRWDLSSWIPDAVVVNLGTNDYGVQPFLPENAFVEAFEAWLEEIRTIRRGIPLVLVDGPLLADDHPSPGTRTLVRGLLDRIAAGSGAVRFSLSPSDPLDGFAADFHPSVVQHERNAREFASFLAGLPGLGRGRYFPRTAFS